MKKYLIAVLLANCTLVVRAQSLSPQTINAGGGQGNAGTLYLDWSVGEMAGVQTLTSPANMLSQGLLQPDAFAPFPVKLIYFTGKTFDAQNELRWATSEETNNEYFQVERSSDGLIFYSLTRIAGTGNSTQSKTYHYYDLSPVALSYYRLKQVDYDGTYSYSKIVALKQPLAAAQYVVYPNPTDGVLNVSGIKIDKPVELYVLDIAGRVMTQQKSGAAENIKLDLQALPAGTYILNVVDQRTGSGFTSLFGKH
ncbi:T9SS type A sorting domain-containing protein [Dyadobacter sp. LJ53]|uniref:T9SS type A sorting domain-containing protein n=1 Tax=Dyadobacter chenwenxiniae TaxID=2906456 RepID=UPI001F159FCE|nr:T9SS type A sorting domain-containing protein [Dyadobacter chenwenxiniae]MCF0051582.1 T9SS type A sorting domain-containing protein [Dyadobacter chenwenxiniae]